MIYGQKEAVVELSEGRERGRVGKSRYCRTTAGVDRRGKRIVARRGAVWRFEQTDEGSYVLDM